MGMVTERRLVPPAPALSCRGSQRANDVSAQMCLLRDFGVKDNRTDGRFFDCAQNDMFCNHHPGNASVTPAPSCHAEEAIRLTKHLLQRRMRPEHRVLGLTCQAARRALLPSPCRGGAGGEVALWRRRGKTEKTTRKGWFFGMAPRVWRARAEGRETALQNPGPLNGRRNRQSFLNSAEGVVPIAHGFDDTLHAV